MGWALFIDDERMPPDNGRDWFVARNWYEVHTKISALGFPSHISFDHDLGEDEIDGYEIARKLVEMDMDGYNGIPENFTFYVHSQNPVGAKNIDAYLNLYLNMKRNGEL